MRIDKYLKVSRVIKRRAVAANACDGGRIEINGKSVKPSKEVKLGDVVAVSFGDKKFTFKVLYLDEKASKANAHEMYEIVENWNKGLVDDKTNVKKLCFLNFFNVFYLLNFALRR